MSRNLIVGLIIGAVLLLGVGTFVLSSRNSAPEQTSSNPVAITSPEASEKKSLKDLFSLGSSQQCTFNDTEAGNSGIVYLADQKFRGDFETKIGADNTASHMISDGKDMYLWMDDQKTGFKMSMESVENTADAQSQSIDINKQVDYKCSSWSVDQSKFVISADIKFSDLSQLIPSSSTTPAVSGMPSISCSTCDSLTGDSKTQCKAALKCN